MTYLSNINRAIVYTAPPPAVSQPDGATSSRSRQVLINIETPRDRIFADVTGTQFIQCSEGRKLSKPVGLMISDAHGRAWAAKLWAKVRDGIDVAAFWAGACFLVTVIAVVVAG